MTDANTNWSYFAGERGRNRVRAFVEAKSEMLYLEWHEEVDGERKRRRTSLGHRDREEAKSAADRKAARLADAEEETEPSAPDAGDPTLGTLFDSYLETETPHKGESKQGHDRRAARMFLDLYGEDRRVMSLTLGDWMRYIRGRRDGTVRPLDEDGEKRPLTSRQRERRERGEPIVRNRAIEYDLKFLWAVLNWAASTADDEGRLLVPRNPLEAHVKARHWPKEHNPNRPVLTDEQYRAMRSYASERDDGSELALVLAHETGHRIGSIRKLRWSEIDLAGGWIVWPARTDKNGRRHRTPLTEEAEAALREARPATPGDARSEWVFPAPGDPTEPCSRHLVRDWWNRAQSHLEDEGLLDPDTEGLGWHALRRKFASDLRDLPLKDLADLGGWEQTETIVQCYQNRDEERMREALARRESGGDGG